MGKVCPGIAAVFVSDKDISIWLFNLASSYSETAIHPISSRSLKGDKLAILVTGASIPPETMMHFPLCFRFPHFRKFLSPPTLTNSPLF